MGSAAMALSRYSTVQYTACSHGCLQVQYSNSRVQHILCCHGPLLVLHRTVQHNTFCAAMALSRYCKLHTLIPDIYYTLLHTLIADHHPFQCLCSGLLPAAEAVQEAHSGQPRECRVSEGYAGDLPEFLDIRVPEYRST